MFSVEPREAAGALVGYLGETPVGLVAFDQGREAETGCGWMTCLAVREGWRGHGYGVQLLGQAVQRVRAAGGTALRAPAPEGPEARGFLTAYGFRPAPDGSAWEKSIAFDPEFLGA